MIIVKKPKIRFKGFTETWEQRKFNNLFVERRDKTKEENEDTLLSCAIDGMYLNSELFSHFRGSSTIGYLKVKKNDLILSAQNLHLGNANVNLRFESGIISPAYKVFNLIDCEPNYVQAWVKKDSTKNFFLSCTTEGASVCRKNIDWNALKNNLLFLPNLDEQKKIGSFFSKLDHLITLHQRKCENLKKLKKFMLQKLFPQNGKNVPKVRFLIFTDTWEQRKFKNIAERLSESYMSDDKNPSVEYEDIISELGTINKDIFNKRIRKNGIKFSNNEILYGKLRPYLHNWLKPDFNGIAVGDWWVLKPINCDREFIFRLIQTSTFDNIANQSNGTKMPRADWNLISNSDFYLPISIYEQKQIGSLFSKLDHLITLHQSKCDKLKEVKKYMLQNMFI